MHCHAVNASNGDLIDIIPLCSDSCHLDYDRDRGLKYEGVSVDYDPPDDNTYCAQCGVIAACGPDACEHQRDNIVVNRFLSESGETCEHGNWIQVPERMLK